MKTFIYRGYHRDGTRRKGTVEALDLKDAREKLSRGGVFPEHIDSATGTSPTSPRWSGRSGSLNRLSVRSEWYRAMAALMKAGLPAGAAFEVMLDQPEQLQTAAVSEMAGIRDRVRDGSGFGHALLEGGIGLSSFERAVIESGERTGRLPDVLEQIADVLDEAGRIHQSLKTALIYPTVIIALALIVGVGVMGFLVPQLAALFEDSGMPLPAITRWVVGAGHWFLPVIFPVSAGLVIVACVGGRRWLQRPSGRVQFERLLSRLPFFRSGFQLLVTVRFTRTCALMLGGGVPMVEAIALSGQATGSAWLAGILEEKSTSVRHGQSFSSALAEVPVLGGTLSSWVRAGEAAGDIPGMFDHAARRYHQSWQQYLQRVVTVVEPALIILVAVFVLLVALAILLPILSLNQQLG